MITKLIYNCDPESLADVSQEAFVDAFEAEVYADPRMRAADITVTFELGRTRLVSISGDDSEEELAHLHGELSLSCQRAMERAWQACLDAEV